MSDTLLCSDWGCPNRTSLGYCKLTACNKPQYNQFNTPTYSQHTLYFPLTIGKVTFYSYQQLVNWIEDQQKMEELLHKAKSDIR